MMDHTLFIGGLVIGFLIAKAIDIRLEFVGDWTVPFAKKPTSAGDGGGDC